MINNLPAMQETQVLSLCWEDPLERGMATIKGSTEFLKQKDISRPLLKICKFNARCNIEQ